MQRRMALVVLSIDIGPVGDEQCGNIWPFLSCRRVQERSAQSVRCIDIFPLVDQSFDFVEISFIHGLAERTHATGHSQQSK